MLHAPYNFVPLSNQVFIPDWMDDINHDIPFEDGESACLTIRLTAESPIYVRNGLSRHDQDSNTAEYRSFSAFDGSYFLPGSSLKGMIRSVLEVFTFSALTPIDDKRFAYRDLSSAQNAYLTAFRENKPHCGWLEIGGDGTWSIRDCGIPARLPLKEIDRIAGSRLAPYFLSSGPADFKNDSEKTARRKYELFGSRSLTAKFETEQDKCGRKIAKHDASGKEGTIVFTGQPGPRKEPTEGKPSGKHLEFVFFSTTDSIRVPDSVRDDFLFNYYDGDRDKESLDWAFWKIERISRNGKIPVFFRLSSQGQIIDLGLSYLYKLPHANRTVDCLPYAHKDSPMDMARAIFGHVKKNNALKGRVQFSHAFAEGDPIVLEEKHEVLGGPKASYWPNYVKQETGVQDGLAVPYTLYEGNARLRGWKRYPVHHGGAVAQNRPEGVSERVYTHFKPLAANTVFTGKVRFHNLKKAEIGALLSALTFHNTPLCRHSIGMAKPLGYGKVRLEIVDTGALALSVNEYFKEFEKVMAVEGGIEDWGRSVQIKELFSMAVSQNNQGRSELRYMDLDGFQNAKTNHEYLADYSKLPGVDEVVPDVFLSPSEIREIKIARARLRQEEEEKRLHEEREAREKAEEEACLAKERATQEKAEKLAAEDEKRKREAMAIGLAGLEGQTDARKIAGAVKNFFLAKQAPLTPEEMECIRQAVSDSFKAGSKKDRNEWLKDPKKSKFWNPMRDALGGTNLIKEWQKGF